MNQTLLGKPFWQTNGIVRARNTKSNLLLGGCQNGNLLNGGNFLFNFIFPKFGFLFKLFLGVVLCDTGKHNKLKFSLFFLWQDSALTCLLCTLAFILGFKVLWLLSIFFNMFLEHVHVRHLVMRLHFTNPAHTANGAFGLLGLSNGGRTHVRVMRQVVAQFDTQLLQSRSCRVLLRKLVVQVEQEGFNFLGILGSNGHGGCGHYEWREALHALLQHVPNTFLIVMNTGSHSSVNYFISQLNISGMELWIEFVQNVGWQQRLYSQVYW